MRKAKKPIFEDCLFYGEPQEDELKGWYSKGWADCAKEYKDLMEWNSEYYENKHKKGNEKAYWIKLGWSMFMLFIGGLFTLRLLWLCDGLGQLF